MPQFTYTLPLRAQTAELVGFRRFTNNKMLQKVKKHLREKYGVQKKADLTQKQRAKLSNFIKDFKEENQDVILDNPVDMKVNAIHPQAINWAILFLKDHAMMGIVYDPRDYGAVDIQNNTLTISTKKRVRALVKINGKNFVVKPQNN